jgi:hypothetical protein
LPSDAAAETGGNIITVVPSTPRLALDVIVMAKNNGPHAITPFDRPPGGVGGRRSGRQLLGRPRAAEEYGGSLTDQAEVLVVKRELPGII